MPVAWEGLLRTSVLEWSPANPESLALLFVMDTVIGHTVGRSGAWAYRGKSV
jgi:hypothetical protein